MLAKLSSLFLLVSFVLLFLVSLSIPIIKSIYLFRLTANASSSIFDSSASGTVKFGVWGYCTSDTEIESVSILLTSQPSIHVPVIRLFAPCDIPESSAQTTVALPSARNLI